MWREKANDDVKYQKVDGQSEFDKFLNLCILMYNITINLM